MLKRILIGLAGSLAALAGIGWLGLQIRPQSTAPANLAPQDLGSIAIPSTLPAPVRRYLQVACGERIPRSESLVTWGSARLNLGLWMPVRFQLYHLPGRAFRREMKITWFGIPVMRALDSYLDNKGMTGPSFQLESGPGVDQGANMILWAEATFYPSLLVTDPRIHWEAIDQNSARLLFPFGDGQDELIFHFDPATGLVTRTWAMRSQGNGGKAPWFAEIVAWQTINGIQVPKQVAVTWEAQGKPWSIWDFEGMAWNVDVTEALSIAENTQVR
ncbi:MAG: DUF6544 family protein [Caldilineaceae bacterium]